MNNITNTLKNIISSEASARAVAIAKAAAADVESESAITIQVEGGCVIAGCSYTIVITPSSYAVYSGGDVVAVNLSSNK